MEIEGRLRSYSLRELPGDLLREAKREGFSDRRIARLVQWEDGHTAGTSEGNWAASTDMSGGVDATATVVEGARLREVAKGGSSAGVAPAARTAGADDSRAIRRRAALVLAARKAQGLHPVFRRVDTCAGEFPSDTPYLYSTWEDGPCESRPSGRRKVIVLGGGPNRIGQGIEFDTCCCHAVQALRADGIEAIMINCNPETVSTDYDLSDRLYFEPLRFEEVMHIVEVEKPEGVIVTLGGQTPLNLARELHEAGVPLLGTGVEAIDRAEDRDRCGRMLHELEIPSPQAGSARDVDTACRVAGGLGYPVMVRPSYVLGGRAMRVVYDEPQLREWFAAAAHGQRRAPGAHRSVSGRCRRVRRRRRVRRTGRADRRHHGAHRGVRHPQRRQLRRAAALQDERSARLSSSTCTRAASRASWASWGCSTSSSPATGA